MKERLMQLIREVAASDNTEEAKDTLSQASYLCNLKIAHVRDREWLKANPGGKVLHGIRMVDIHEIAPGLFSGRQPGNACGLSLFDGQNFRGSITHWGTKKHPDGMRIHTWSPKFTKEIRKQYADIEKAEKGLIFYGRKFNQEAA